MSHALDISEIAAIVVDQLEFDREALLKWALINRAFAHPCAVKLGSNVLLRTQVQAQLFVSAFSKRAEMRIWVRHVTVQVELNVYDLRERRWQEPWIDRALCRVILALPNIIKIHLSFPAQENQSSLIRFPTRVGKYLTRLVSMPIPSISISNLADIPPTFFEALRPATELSLENCRIEWQSHDELSNLIQMLMRQGPTHASPISKLRLHGMNHHSLSVLYAHCGGRFHGLNELSIKLINEVSELSDVLSMTGAFLEASAETLEYLHLETPYPGLRGGFIDLPEDSRLLDLGRLSRLRVFSLGIQASLIDRNRCYTEELTWSLLVFKSLPSDTQIAELQLRIRADGRAPGLEESLSGLALLPVIWKAWDRELIRFRALKSVKLVFHSPMCGNPARIVPMLTQIQECFLILSAIPGRFHISYQAL